MDIYSRKFIIMLAVAAVALAYSTIIYYIAAGEFTYISFKSFLGVVITVLAIIAIMRGEDIEKARKWFWKIFFIIVIVLLLASIFFGLEL